MHGFSSSDKRDSLVTNNAKIVDIAEANVEELVSNSQKRTFRTWEWVVYLGY